MDSGLPEEPTQPAPDRVVEMTPEYKQFLADTVAEVVRDVIKAKEDKELPKQPEVERASPDENTKATNTDGSYGEFLNQVMQGKTFSYLNPFAASAWHLQTITASQASLIQSLRHENDLLRDSVKRAEERIGEECPTCREDKVKSLREVVLETVRDVFSDLISKETSSTKRRTRLSAPPEMNEPAPDVRMEVDPAPAKEVLVLESKKRASPDEGNATDEPEPKRLKDEERKNGEDTGLNEKPDSQNANGGDTSNMMHPQKDSETVETSDAKPSLPQNLAKKDSDSDVELTEEALSNLDKKAEDFPKAPPVNLPAKLPLKDLKPSNEEAITALRQLQTEKEGEIERAEAFMELKKDSTQATVLHQKLRGMGRACLGNQSKPPTSNSLFAAVVKESDDVAADGPALRLNLIDFMTTYSSSFVKVSCNLFFFPVVPFYVHKCSLLPFAGDGSTMR